MKKLARFLHRRNRNKLDLNRLIRRDEPAAGAVKNFEYCREVACALTIITLVSLSCEPATGAAAAASPSAITKIREQLALDTVDGLLLFDHLFTKSATAMSSDYLGKLADPGSHLHADYLEYKNGHIGRRELIARLPHVAMIGD